MKKTLLLLTAMLFPAAALAAGAMKPGLWEMTMKSDALKDVPQIPKEQLEQMRRMGIEVPQMSGGAIVSKVCVTPQMAASQAPGLGEMEMGCKPKNTKHSGASYSADIVCNGDLKGTGKVSGKFEGGERYTSVYEFKGTMHGQPVNHRQESSGRWLAKDCGSVRPLGD